MNNKFIVTQNEVIISDEHGNLKVLDNNNLREQLKLENNLEDLNIKYNELDEKQKNLHNDLKKIDVDKKKSLIIIIIKYALVVLLYAIATNFNIFPGIFSVLMSVFGGIEIVIENKHRKKKKQELEKELKVVRLNKSLASNERNIVLKALIDLKSSEKTFVEEFEINYEYSVDDNYDYTFTEAEILKEEDNKVARD